MNNRNTSIVWSCGRRHTLRRQDTMSCFIVRPEEADISQLNNLSRVRQLPLCSVHTSTVSRDGVSQQASRLLQRDRAMRYGHGASVEISSSCCTTVGTDWLYNNRSTTNRCNGFRSTGQAPQRVDRRKCGQQSRSTVDEFCWQHDRLAVAKFSRPKSRVWDKVSERSATIFGGIRISRYVEESFHAKTRPDQFSHRDTIAACVTDRQTDRQTHGALL